jgi:hypothetical protein
MIVRRVVTGRAADGSSVVRMDGQPPRVVQLPSFPDFCGAFVWSTSGVPGLSGNIEDPTPGDASFVPAPGESRLHVMRFPPDSLMWGPGADTAEITAEQRAQMPGLADAFEADGMHATDTLDYAIVIEGEAWLELDNGTRTRLTAGDVVIQQGTRHAWRNTSDRPVTMAFVLIGAKR